MDFLKLDFSSLKSFFFSIQYIYIYKKTIFPEWIPKNVEYERCIFFLFFYPEYKKRIFSAWIFPKTSNQKNDHFWPKNMENFEFLDFFKTWLFLSKKHYFLPRISKNDLSLLDLPKNHKWKNGHFWPKPMDQPLWKISIFWTLLKVDLFCLKRILFYPEYKKNDLSSLDLPKNCQWEKWPSLAKPYTNPFGNFDLLDFFRSWLLLSWSILFYPEYQQTIFNLTGFAKKPQMRKMANFGQKAWTNPLENFGFFGTFFKLDFPSLKSVFFYSECKKLSFQAGFVQKPAIRKMTIFGQKPWTNPFGKCRFFRTFLKLDFSCLNSILFYLEHQKTTFPDRICQKTSNEKNDHFWPKTMD